MLPEQFLLFIKKKKLFLQGDRILLAVSGGIDSVVMAELFHQAKFNFAIAHCNFQLRGKESDGDEQFVKKLAKKYDIKFYSKRFDTKEYAKKSKVSTQVAAREVRYEWFDELCRKEKYNYIATAHHLNDSIETFFINLLRGTGIAGLTGIKAKRGSIIRPLLFADRSAIESFARKNKISSREDSSNLSDDYLRNKIRHSLIPLFKQLNPQFEQIMSDNLSRFDFADTVVSEYIKQKEKKLFKSAGKFPSINIAELNAEPFPEQVLFSLLDKFGFNFSQCEEMLSETGSGKTFTSKHYCMLRDRGNLLLKKNKEEKPEGEQVIQNKTKKIVTNAGELKMSSTVRTKGFRPSASNGIQCLDYALLKFPLLLRRWKAGDYFHPLGMKHRKKLSDFFIDQKSNLFDKERIYVITSENEIVCILAHRIDDRFKVTDKTKKIYKLEMKYF